MTKDKNILMLIDFENIYIPSIKQYELQITESGLDKLIELASIDKKLDNSNILVFAFWDHYKLYKQYFTNSFYSVIDVSEDGESCADGYLIVNGMAKLSQQKDDIDEVILFGGDSVYSGLVRYLLSIGKKVKIYSWKNSYYSKLRINRNVEVFYIDDVLNVKERDDCVKDGYFTSSVLSDGEKAVIKRFLTTKFDYLYLTTTANDILKSTDIGFNDINLYQDAIDFLYRCVDNGILLIDRRTGHRDGDLVKVLIINKEHSKVKAVSQLIKKK